MTVTEAVDKAAQYLRFAEDETDLAKSENFVRIAETYTATATLLAEVEVG